MSEPINDALAKRKLKTELKRQQRQEAKKVEDAGVTEPVTWVGYNSADGSGVVRTQSGEIRTGVEVVTQGQIQPGNSILGLEGASGFVTGNQMPAPTRHRQPERRRPQLTPKTNTAYLVETVYESEKEVTPSCDLDPKLSIVFIQEEDEFTNVAILYGTLHYRLDIPHEFCKCDRWQPSSQGCVIRCNGDGEYETQGECEDELANPPPPGVTNTYWAFADYNSNYNPGFTAGQAPYNSQYNGEPIERPIYVVRGKNGEEIVDYRTGIDPDISFYPDGLPPIENTPQGKNRWITSDQQIISWEDVDLYQIGSFSKYNTGMEIVSGMGNGDAYFTSPSGLPLYANLVPGGSPPVTGNVFVQEDFSISYSYTHVGADGNLLPAGTLLGFIRSFSHYGKVTSWLTLSQNNPPIYYPPPQPPYSTENYPPGQQSYRTLKLWVGGYKKGYQLFLGEYVVLNSQTRINGDQESAQQGVTYPYYKFINNNINLVAHITALDEHTFQVIIKSESFKQLFRISGSERILDRIWCNIEVITIRYNSVVRSNYRYAQIPVVDPRSWAYAFYTNWFLRKNIPPNTPSNFDYLGDENGHSPGELLFSYYNTGSLSGYFDIAYPYYLYNLLGDFWRGFNTAEESPPNQAWEAGLAHAHPYGFSRIGVNFTIYQGRSYAFDTKPDQWLPLQNSVFIDAIKTQDCDIFIKCGYYSPSLNLRSSNLYALDYQFTRFLFDTPHIVKAKVYSLNTPDALIFEITSYIDPDTAEQSIASLPFNIYEANIKYDYYEGSLNSIGNRIWSENNVLPGSYSPISDQGDSSQGFLWIRYGLSQWQGLSVNVILSEFESYNVYVPIEFKGCNGTNLSTDQPPYNYYGERTNLRLPHRPKIIGQCPLNSTLQPYPLPPFTLDQFPPIT